MTLPAGYRMRPVTHEDLESVVALMNAVDLAEIGEEDSVRPFLLETWTHPRTTLDADTRVVVAPDDRIAAYSDLTVHDITVAIDVWTRVHPEFDDPSIRESLLDWSEARAAERLTSGSTPIWHATSSVDRAAAHLLLARGYRHIRTFWHMTRAIEGTEVSGEAPEGIRIRVAVPGDDDVAIHAADRESFIDHFGFHEETLEEFWRDQRAYPLYDPDMIFIAESDDGELAGFTINSAGEGIGWVGELGVRPAWRGRGVATALLRTSFADFAARGLPVARLNVDSENTTGATRLYEKVGMTVWREWHVYEKGITAE